MSARGLTWLVAILFCALVWWGIGRLVMSVLDASYPCSTPVCATPGNTPNR